ncbi:MAG: hypothetical protein OEW88_04595 [Gammaproteobacteria bacterium]|nr:hypothetical protein [Gammaproteobacteria bacterium]
MDFSKQLSQAIEHGQRMWTFRWPGLAAAWLAAAAGWAVVVSLPDEYDSSARVYVNAETVLKPLLQGLTVPTDPMEQVNLMTRALLSRPHLETVIAKTGLERRAATVVERERLLDELTVTIQVDRDPGQGVYTILYTDQDPQMAQAVVQELLDDFMADTMRGDNVSSAQAQAFLERQIKIDEQRLTDAEERLADFKQRNLGLVQGGSGPGTDYYARFQAAQSAVQSLQSEVRSLTNRRNELARQLSGQDSGSSTTSMASTSVDAAISNLEAENAQLRLRYTDKHPDIISNRQTLEDLYKIREQELRARAAGIGTPSRAIDPVSQQLKIALSAADADLAALQSQLSEKSAEVSYLRGMANTIPEVEAQLARLNRDYNVIKEEYETLLRRLESIKMNQEVQADKGDVQFRIIEPPYTPVMPSGPDRLRFNTMVLIAAVGVGLAVAFFLGHRDPAFFSATSLREATGLPVYGTVGVYGIVKDNMMVWRFPVACISLLASYAIILVLNATGTS